jgi:serine/threonine protein kinase
MAIEPGRHLGPYEVTGAIGAGGMGEVYRARDAKLGRDVALKVLPEAFARDAERMARFQREAKVLASLDHPNIASIYGLEDSSSTHALVMQLVEGPTLADRIKSGPIPIDEALRIAKQICEALEYAHERGIVHRDLKPANVKVTRDDAVKVLDFGLAKALEGDAASIDISTSPTISRLATQAGVLLGTAAYMSPEQAKGKVVDRRADIWAFGCVLYEMLTGQMAFRGEAVTDTLAAVIKEEPDWSQLPAATPIRSAACRRTRSSDCRRSATRASRSTKFFRARRTRRLPALRPQRRSGVAHYRGPWRRCCSSHWRPSRSCIFGKRRPLRQNKCVSRSRCLRRRPSESLETSRSHPTAASWHSQRSERMACSACGFALLIRSKRGLSPARTWEAVRFLHFSGRLTAGSSPSKPTESLRRSTSRVALLRRYATFVDTRWAGPGTAMGS